MKCKDCDACEKGFFKSQPNKWVCIGVAEPFIIKDINSECTEYPTKNKDIKDDSVKIIEAMTENSNLYVNLKELVERFVEIDKYYHHEPWNLKQIIANINILVPVEIGEDHEQEKKN